jgi:hypothetical protein
VAGVLATAAVEELRDRHVGEPEGIVEFAVGKQASVRGNPCSMEFDLDAAIESGSQRGLFGFTRPVARSNPVIGLTKSGDHEIVINLCLFVGIGRVSSSAHGRRREAWTTVDPALIRGSSRMTKIRRGAASA